MAGRLAGKTAVVTGAASGMGEAIALAFVREGANVLGLDLNKDDLEYLGEQIEELGLSAQYKYMVGDITSDEDCENAVKLCVDTYGTCNVLSHNAGITDNFTLVHDLENKDWDRQISVNLTGTMKISRAALRYFLANDIKASIVLVTSNAAFESATGGPAYCASKAGANALMKSIAFEYGRKGIRCNSICPGPTMTSIVTSAGQRNDAGAAVHHKTGYNAHYKEWALKMVAMPEEIAPLAVYLASDEASFMNSSSVIIDGGVCLG